MTNFVDLVSIFALRHRSSSRHMCVRRSRYDLACYWFGRWQPDCTRRLEEL